MLLHPAPLKKGKLRPRIELVNTLFRGDGFYLCDAPEGTADAAPPPGCAVARLDKPDPTRHIRPRTDGGPNLPGETMSLRLVLLALAVSLQAGFGLAWWAAFRRASAT